MNEKYEIIIKENGEEIKRVSVKGFAFTAEREEKIYTLAKANEKIGVELTFMTDVNAQTTDQLLKSSRNENQA